MNIENLTRITTIAFAFACFAGPAADADPDNTNHRGASVNFAQIRNATIKVEYAGTVFLIDPMLGDKGAYPGFEGTVNSHLRNPLVELPIPVSEVIKADAVIVTHTHLDHWDDAAKNSLPKNIPIFAQNQQDAESIVRDGFINVQVLTDHTDFNGIRLSKTAGQHGSQAMLDGRKEKLGKSSGIVFQRSGYKTLYVAGDTVWNQNVEDAIEDYHPDVIVLNTCYGRLEGYEGAFIMGKEDLYRAHRAAPNATIVGSHMEAIAHCTQTRQELLGFITEKGMSPQRVLIPEDGESLTF